MTIIERRICIEPKYLSSNLMYHLEQKIIELTSDECTKDYGYIIKVNKLIGVKDNIISSANSDIIFTVIFDADTLKPEMDSVLKAEVCMLFSKGIFLIVQEKLKVLIPNTTINNYTEENDRYFNDKKEIKLGDILSVKITGIKYSDKNFNCFGELQ